MVSPQGAPLRFGNYEILERIAAGGMAEVFRARVVGAHGFTKDFAIKRILPHLCEEEDFISMLVDEARILVTLDHPNIVSVHEFNRADGHYLLVMELVRGRSLYHVHKRSEQTPGAKLTIEDVLFIGSQAAAALAYAHARRDSSGRPLGVVHRDVSPQNVLISWHGDVKVVDFGVAKAAGKLTATRAGVIKGKFAYMSPEQARGEEIDARSDIFALGIVLWELLAHKRLFRGESETATLRNVMSQPIPSLAQVDPQIPGRVAAILRRALERRRDDRYPDAAALESDLVTMLHRLQPGYTRRHLAERMGGLFAAEIAEEAARPLAVEQTVCTPSGLGSGAKAASAMEQARQQAQVAALDGAPTVARGSDPSEARTPPPAIPDLAKVEDSIRMQLTPSGQSEPSSRSARSGRSATELVSSRLEVVAVHRPWGRIAGIVAGIAAICAALVATALILRQSPTAPAVAPAVVDAAAAAPPDAAAAAPLSVPGLMLELSRADAATAAADAGARTRARERRTAPARRSVRRTPSPPAPVKVATPPTAVPAAREGRGRLSVNSDPWGRVTIDGRAVGNTPLMRFELDAGSHRVEIQNPVTGQHKVFSVVVKAGEEVRRMVTLQ